MRAAPLLLLGSMACGGADTEPTALWFPCGDALWCTDLDPGPDQVIGAWHPGTAPTGRVIALADGGPGGSSVELLRALLTYWGPADPELWEEVDWVAVDNRGVGLSDPTACVDGAWWDAIRATAPVPADGDAEAEVVALRDAFQAGCLADRGEDGLAALGTPTYADDLDALRDAVGAETLDLLGFSYGTWIGAVYASAYPDRVGRFALDGVVAPDRTRDAFLTAQAAGFEEALGRYFDRCRADPGCADGDDPQLRYERVLASAPLAAPGDPEGRQLSRNDIRWAVVGAMYGPDDDAVTDGIAAADAGDGTVLLAVADAGWGRVDADVYDPLYERYFAIGCLDQPWPAGWTDADVWAFGAELDVAFPWTGSSLISAEIVCQGWPVTAPPAPIGAPDAPPLLLINGAYDPATPFDDAVSMQAALGNGSDLLRYEGDGHVALFQDGTGCVYDAVRSFLLDGERAPASCP